MVRYCAAVSNNPRIAAQHQNARLDQEEQLTSITLIKRPRSLYCEEKGVQDGDPSHPPLPPSGDFEVRSHGFWQIFRIFADFPKTCTFCNNHYVNDLIVKLYKSKNGQRLCLEDASIKNIYLFVVSCKIKYATYTYSELEAIKAMGRGEAPSVGGTSLQRQYLLRGARNKNKNGSRPLKP